eukprot:TRINITY_DN2502_c0_g2_i4.p1 TRINITY_DN2502_c0_g2~~TRINITY_DN2502_c0_g2_i4.p1  ORF type:complete len:192 (+),score=46.08 TRINITY_DN2502_c0_g2_i4:574-1149(+)
MKDGKFLKTSCGSPNYAAPEVISGKPYCGTEIDTWSCGVILYALLAGCLPFDEDVIPLLFRKIKEADYTIPKHFSEEAKDLIKWMMQPNPVNRIKFHEIRRHPWFKDAFPLYYDIRDYSNRLDNFKIDEDVFKSLIKMDFNFSNLNEEKIRKLIKEGKEYSFVTAYDLLVDDAKKRKRRETNSKHLYTKGL